MINLFPPDCFCYFYSPSEIWSLFNFVHKFFYLKGNICIYITFPCKKKKSNSTKEYKMKRRIAFQLRSPDTSTGLKYSFRIFCAHMGVYPLSNASLLQTVFCPLFLLLNDIPRNFLDSSVDLEPIFKNSYTVFHWTSQNEQLWIQSLGLHSRLLWTIL